VAGLKLIPKASARQIAMAGERNPAENKEKNA